VPWTVQRPSIALCTGTTGLTGKSACWRWCIKLRLTMTALKVESGSESYLTGQPSSPRSADFAGGQLIVCEFSASRPVPLANTRSLSDVVAEFAQNADVAEKLPAARRRVGQTLFGNELSSLAAMRLNAGLSQAGLAVKAETSQPHIARIEKGQTDPGTDLIVRVANALGVEPSRVFDAVCAQRSNVVSVA
jgi:DNA-binding XRE family transcriptional regulator